MLVIIQISAKLIERLIKKKKNQTIASVTIVSDDDGEKLIMHS